MDRGIRFLHPGYECPFNVLLILPRTDPIPRPVEEISPFKSNWGISHATALVACQIIANNRFDGFFSQDPEGTRRIHIDNVPLLEHNEYYFIVPGPGNTILVPFSIGKKVVNGNLQPYPVVPSFQDWAFPHNSIPSAWRSVAEASTSVVPAGTNRSREVPISRCPISNVTWSRQLCHLVPQNERPWYQFNAMDMYQAASVNSSIDGSANRCYFRSDVCTALDQFIFALVPRENGYQVHALQDWGPWAEFAAEFHGQTFHGQVKAEFLFARFAAAVFSLFKPFITNPEVRRRVARRRPRSLGESSSPMFSIKVEWMTGKELCSEYAEADEEDDDDSVGSDSSGLWMSRYVRPKRYYAP
ncbi:hypothetical protein F4777DRAFT_430305 [Nemania sp. FL0916]|nr:hypothetical protein F4777DRAFT_430305 [Nemania sp. FL0916]